MGALDDAKTTAEEASKLKADPQLVHELLTAIKHIETSQRRQKFWKKGLSYAAILITITVVIFVILDNIGPKPDPMRKSSISNHRSPPPSLSIKAVLSKRYLLAGRTENLTLIIKNSGGMAHNVKISLQPLSKAGLNYKLPAPIPQVKENGEKRITIPITADRNIGTREEPLKIELLGNNETPLATTNFLLKILDTER